MTRDIIFTFKFFLENNNSEIVELFKKTFVSDMSTLPDKRLTSKQTRTYFNLDNLEKEYLFKTVYMIYFKRYIF